MGLGLTRHQQSRIVLAWPVAVAVAVADAVLTPTPLRGWNQPLHCQHYSQHPTAKETNTRLQTLIQQMLPATSLCSCWHHVLPPPPHRHPVAAVVVVLATMATLMVLVTSLCRAVFLCRSPPFPSCQTILGGSAAQCNA